MKLFMSRFGNLLVLLVSSLMLLTACRAPFSSRQTVKAQSFAIAPALPVIPDRIYNVTNYGAVGDGVATNTAAIQAAINTASAAGGGEVEIPKGVFLCGPIRLASQINLHLDDGALLRMLPMGKYPAGGRSGSFISGDRLHDVAITGSGAIDGQGAPWWPLAKTPQDYRRPRMITPSNCERLLIEGITLSNSPMFHIAISGNCTNVTVRGVTIRAPASTDPVCPSHNTDACDVKGRNILIENCDVSVGDDNFTCGGNTSDVLIKNCTYGFGHGVSIGSPTRGGVSNITVINCTFSNTECGIRIKSDRDRGGFVHNMKYLNLRMTNVGCPILIYESYMAEGKEYRNLNNLTPEIAATYPAAPVGERTPIYSDFVFSNIIATAESGRRAGLIWGLPEMNVTNVLLEKVNITADKPFGIYCAQGVRLVNSKIITPGGVNKLSCTNAQVTITPRPVQRWDKRTFKQPVTGS
jgi:polygalacturonase